MDMDDSDAVLVGRVREGDALAFDTLVRRHLRSAYAVALARLGEPADAEDVCQDAFVAALQRIEECRQPDRFGAWLISIVRNRAHDHARARAVRSAAPLDDAEFASGAPGPQRLAERAELTADLLAALSALPELQREVLMLFDLEGWSHREIAERLGISEGSARVHLHHGRKALRERLTARYGGADERRP
jgi:RNA polymerase sigma-70 factor, ECF subfamily